MPPSGNQPQMQKKLNFNNSKHVKNRSSAKYVEFPQIHAINAVALTQQRSN